MTAPHTSPIYDAVIVGAGPAGLSAALQLARSNRQVVVIDSGAGRSTYRQVNHNYLGFPGGIAARELRELARKQVSMYPVAFVDEPVVSLARPKGHFTAVLASERRLVSRTLVLATGVRDHFPQVPEWETYVGRSLFWCIVCDGYSARGKNVLAVGNDDEAAVTALQFLQFTDRVTLLTNSLTCEVSAASKRALQRHGVSHRERPGRRWLRVHRTVRFPAVRPPPGLRREIEHGRSVCPTDSVPGWRSGEG